MKKIILLIVFAFALSFNAFGQAKEISSEEHRKLSSEIFDRFFKTAVRRQTSKEEFYRDGKLDYTTDSVFENISPDKSRKLVMKISDKKTKRSELIKIGETVYCRINNYNWTNSENSCYTGISPGISRIVSSRFSVETVKKDGKIFNVYRKYIIFKSTDSLNPEEVILSFYEEELWVDEQNVLTAEKFARGLEKPKQIQSKGVRNYEYDPNIKIEAPVK